MPDLVDLTVSYEKQDSFQLARTAATFIVQKVDCCSLDVIKAILKKRKALNLLDWAVANFSLLSA